MTNVIDRNLLAHAAKRMKRSLAPSDEVATVVARLVSNLRAAAAVFMTEDVRAARLLAAEKEWFRDLETAATEDHFAEIRAGRIDASFMPSGVDSNSITRSVNWSHSCGETVARIRLPGTRVIATSEPSELNRMRLRSSSVGRRFSRHHCSNAG